MTSLCNILEKNLTYLTGGNSSEDNNDVPFINGHLEFLKMIYCIYLLADIYHMLSFISEIFQYKFFYVSSIKAIIRVNIIQIRMRFIDVNIKDSE